MLELYNFAQSTCSLKVRICLHEKALDWLDHPLISKNADHLSDWYLKLNPNGVVPTLIHDGRPVFESSVILQYLDQVFPDAALMPADAYGQAKLTRLARLRRRGADAGGALPLVPVRRAAAQVPGDEPGPVRRTGDQAATERRLLPENGPDDRLRRHRDGGSLRGVAQDRRAHGLDVFRKRRAVAHGRAIRPRRHCSGAADRPGRGPGAGSALARKISARRRRGSNACRRGRPTAKPITPAAACRTNTPSSSSAAARTGT